MPVSDLLHTYDGTAKYASAVTVPTGLHVNLTYDGSPDAPVNAGNYTVIGAINDPNYQGNATEIMLIEKAVADVFLAGLVHTYDGDPKEASATTAPASLTVIFTYDGLPDLPVEAGDYLVIAAIDDANYQGSATATMTINKAVGEIMLMDLEHVYDGTAKEAIAETEPPGLNVHITYDGYPVAPSNAGTYTVVGTIVDNNYSGGATATMTIHKALADVELYALVHDYDGTPKHASTTTNPPNLLVRVTYDGSEDGPSAVGEYRAEASIIEDNYRGSTTGIFIIDSVVPDLYTTPATSISTRSAVSGGNIISTGGVMVTERGVCWNNSGLPDKTDTCTLDGSGDGVFMSILSGLDPATTWFVRAYAVNSAGIGFGNEISFTTRPTWSLVVEKTGSGDGLVSSDPAGIDCGFSCEARFDDVGEVRLIAEPFLNHRFVGWGGDPDCEDGVVMMTEAVRCEAEFYYFPWPMFMPAILHNALPETSLPEEDVEPLE